MRNVLLTTMRVHLAHKRFDSATHCEQLAKTVVKRVLPIRRTVEHVSCQPVNPMKNILVLMVNYKQKTGVLRNLIAVE